MASSFLPLKTIATETDTYTHQSTGFRSRTPGSIVSWFQQCRPAFSQSCSETLMSSIDFSFIECIPPRHHALREVLRVIIVVCAAILIYYTNNEALLLGLGIFTSLSDGYTIVLKKLSAKDRHDKPLLLKFETVTHSLVEEPVAIIAHINTMDSMDERLPHTHYQGLRDQPSSQPIEPISGTFATRTISDLASTNLRQVPSSPATQPWREAVQIHVPNSLCIEALETRHPQHCLHDIISRRALRQPDATAVHTPLETISYEELDKLSWKLAHHLINVDIAPGSTIPICFEKSIELVVAMLGIMKAGSAFVVLDPSPSISELNHILKQVRGKFALVSTAQAASIDLNLSSIIVVSREILKHARDLSEWSDYSWAVPEGTAYVTLAPGPSATVDALKVTHSAFVRAMVHDQITQLQSQSQAAQLLPHSDDFSTEEILAVLMQGGCMIGTRRERGCRSISQLQYE